MPTVNTPPSGRLLSLDVFRGLIMLLLIPDTVGGLSFYLMAERQPDEPIWGLLAQMFSHVRWSGTSVWDLIMPAFMLTAGIAMAYSYAARKAYGQSDRSVLTHAALRSIALIALHLTLSIPVRSRLDYLWPLAILALGLRLPAKLAAALPAWAKKAPDKATLLSWGVVLAIVIARDLLRFDEIPNFELFGLLPTLGLAYFMASLFLPYPPRTQAMAALSILFLYWLAFVLFRQPTVNSDPALYGVTAADEMYSGFLSHWSKGTHLAATFDVWLLNLFPRHYPYTPPIHGTHTLRFIPVTAMLLFGVLFGRALRFGKPREQVRDCALLLAVIAIVVALLLDHGIEPIVMRIWTSSWTIYSTGLVLIVFLGLYSMIELSGHARWTNAFVVVGSNSLLLYVLALGYRWPVIAVWRQVLGTSVFDGYWQPIAESVAFAATLWALAFILYRWRIFVRL